MAEVLLRYRLGDLGCDARVASAGLLQSGQPASAHGVDIMGGRGLDMTTHRSRAMSRELLSSADLTSASRPRSAKRCRRSTSAMGERQMLPVQRKRTLMGTSVTGAIRRVREGRRRRAGSGAPRAAR